MSDIQQQVEEAKKVLSFGILPTGKLLHLVEETPSGKQKTLCGYTRPEVIHNAIKPDFDWKTVQEWPLCQRCKSEVDQDIFPWIVEGLKNDMSAVLGEAYSEKNTRGLFLRGAIWWVTYMDKKGKQHWESSGSQSKEDAMRFLLKRRREIINSGAPAKTLDTIKINDVEYIASSQYESLRADHDLLLRMFNEVTDTVSTTSKNLLVRRVATINALNNLKVMELTIDDPGMDINPGDNISVAVVKKGDKKP